MKANQEPTEKQFATGLNKSTVFGSTLLENETDYFSGQKQHMAKSLSMSNKFSRFIPKGTF